MPVIAGLELRGHPPRGQEHARGWVRVLDAARAPAAAAHDARARPRPARGRDRVAAGGVHGRAARRGRRPRRAGSYPRSRPRSEARQSRMAELPLTWTESELLADHDVVEPLVAGGVRCHGGFDGRRRLRLAAHARTACPRSAPGSSRTASSSAPRSSTRRSSSGPRCSRASRRRSTCCARACRAPTISSLTRIGTVEGFGSMIRAVQVDRSPVALRRVDRRNRDRAPAARTVRSARARRSRLGRRRRPQADVVRGA